jgi:hypothetical protein
MLIKISDTQIYSDSFIRSVFYNPATTAITVTFNDATTATVSGAQGQYIWYILGNLYDAQLR